MPKAKPRATYRHSQEAKRLLAIIALKLGTTRTAALEFMIRNQAKIMGIGDTK